MKSITIIAFLIAILLSGCSQYNDPELAAKIKKLESKDHLDEFDKEELKDLKEQARYPTPDIKSNGKKCQ